MIIDFFVRQEVRLPGLGSKGPVSNSSHVAGRFTYSATSMRSTEQDCSKGVGLPIVDDRDVVESQTDASTVAKKAVGDSETREDGEDKTVLLEAVDAKLDGLDKKIERIALVVGARIGPGVSCNSMEKILLCL